MAFILLRLLVLGVLAAAADDGHVTWLSPPRGVVPCAVGEAGRAPRRPPPPLDVEDRPRVKPYRRKADEDDKRVDGDGSVEVTRRRNGTEGVYQCSVRHGPGVVLGLPVHWKFASLDKQFTKHPENSTASAGQPHAISCEITSAPAASLSWWKDGERLPRDDRFILLKTQLLIMEVRKQDAGTYKCSATNTHLNKTRHSHVGRLDVVDSSDSEPGLLLVQDEANILAERFSPVQLLCPMLGWPRPKVTWEFIAGQSSSILEYNGQILQLNRVDVNQEGVYKCYVNDCTQFCKVFNLTVTEPPIITLPPVSKEVVRASTVRFNCTASGRPAPTISWYKDGKPLELGGRYNMRQSAFGDWYELVIGGVTSGDAGVYQCLARGVGVVAHAWAWLGVPGWGAPAPRALRCEPRAATLLRLRWAPAAPAVMAYTVQSSLPAWPGLPHNNTEENITISEPLTTYEFQVRAFIRGTGKNVASDMSEPVYCQGQGVPVRITKQGDNAVLISWKEFADEVPGVVQWILQYRQENTTEERNITLSGEFHNYTMQVSPDAPIEVRVLGSKTLEWLPQNLSLLAWTSISHHQDTGDSVLVVPEHLRASHVSSHEFTIEWKSELSDADSFVVCVRKTDGSRRCLESYNTTANIDGLDPETEYEVEVQAKSSGRSLGPSSVPLFVTTLSEDLSGSDRFKDLSWKFVNSSTVLVTWRGSSRARVLHSAKLGVPFDSWAAVPATGTSALLTDIDPSKDTYVIVTGSDPVVYSPIKTIPAQVPEVTWHWTRNGVALAWRGAARDVRYSQNLTAAVDTWPILHPTASSAELSGLDPSRPTYVLVAGARGHVLNIPRRPPPGGGLYLGLGIAGGLVVLCLVTMAAFCIWRRRKRARSPLRSRRRNVSDIEEEEEGSELKSVGGRLANGGGSKDAGEPLLNGHVHITENPQTKTPNGKMKKGLTPFDLSRYEDPDATLETVLSDQSTTYELLDTSRKPEDQLNPNDSFPKLPDDNMNSEITRSVSFHLDNSKIQPTLQPNG